MVGVTFDQWGQAGDFAIDPDHVQTVPGSVVIVESGRGLRMGRVTTPPRAAGKTGGGRIRRVIRVAREADLHTQTMALEREPEAFRLALTLARDRGLPLKLLRVALDGVAGRATFFVAAPSKLELRDLADVLSRRLKLKTEVRQLGMRDVARAVGGLGRCGGELCCSTFLTEYPHTSVRMAKDQNMALADDRTSGVCSRTLCCLSYEHETYKEMRRWMPKLGRRAKTADGSLEGKVIGVDVMALTFTLLDDRHNRHSVHARDWERNAGQELPLDESADPAPEASAEPTYAAPPPLPSAPPTQVRTAPQGPTRKKPARRRRRRTNKDRDPS